MVHPIIDNNLLYAFFSFAQVELNPERHLTIDVSCTVKNLDVRLMLAGKRKINTLTVS